MNEQVSVMKAGGEKFIRMKIRFSIWDLLECKIFQWNLDGCESSNDIDDSIAKSNEIQQKIKNLKIA